jgi:hypothetical protein
LAALPPLPVQVSVNVEEDTSAPVDWLPDVGLAPDHAPDATQERARLADHVSVEAPP